MWSLDTNLEVSAEVKRLDARNLTVHGGPSVPGYEQACRDFFARHASVDITLHGEGEVAAIELFERLRREDDGRIGFDSVALGEVLGLSHRDPADAGHVLRAPPRTRLRQLDSLPSPYLAGLFDDYGGRVEAAIVETNRGCPFACTFCDWGSATNGRSPSSSNRVRHEIEWIGRNQVGVLWIADANFGMLKRRPRFRRLDRRGQAATLRLSARSGGQLHQERERRLADIIRMFSDAASSARASSRSRPPTRKPCGHRSQEHQDRKVRRAAAGLFRSLGAAPVDRPDDRPARHHGGELRAGPAALHGRGRLDQGLSHQLLPNSPMAAPAYREKYRIEVDENDFVWPATASAAKSSPA
jgi:hypothetical protein